MNYGKIIKAEKKRLSGQRIPREKKLISSNLKRLTRKRITLQGIFRKKYRAEIIHTRIVRFFIVPMPSPVFWRSVLW